MAACVGLRRCACASEALAASFSAKDQQNKPADPERFYSKDVFLSPHRLKSLNMSNSRFFGPFSVPLQVKHMNSDISLFIYYICQNAHRFHTVAHIHLHPQNL